MGPITPMDDDATSREEALYSSMTEMMQRAMNMPHICLSPEAMALGFTPVAEAGGAEGVGDVEAETIERKFCQRRVYFT